MPFATDTDTDTTTPAPPAGAIEALADRFGPAPVTLLAVWAHPDDESFLGAGLMAEIARRGGVVHSVTATLGEHGTDDPEVDPPPRLAERRRAELDRALSVLGATGTALGYADGSCAAMPDAVGAHRVGVLLDELRPDVVLSFGPDGVTGHPDHRAVNRWTERAVAGTGRAIPLLATGAGAAWPADLLPAMEGTGAFWPGYPERAVPADSWTTTLTGDRLDQKLAALACHESQVGPLQAALGSDGFGRLASVEAYRPANPAAERALAIGRLVAAA